MAATITYDKGADLGLLDGKTVAVLGYGSQGHAHTLNLKESGIDVVVGLRAGSSSAEKAEAAGLKVLTIGEAVQAADVVMVLLPDTEQKRIYQADIEANLVPGNSLAFAHGFNIHFDQIQPPEGVDVWMIAPKGPGHLVRRTYTEGGGVPALVAVAQDATGNAVATALAYAKGIGATRGGVLDTTFQEETETDLFGEQVVLCGGLVELIQNSFETLVEAGYQPESAYFETLHEVKLIVDLIYEGGISNMRYSISDTAEYGDMTRGPRVITSSTKAEMKKILGEIQSGEFAQEWIAENEAGRPNFKKLQAAGREHPIEKVGAELRKMMPWISAGKASPQEVSGGQLGPESVSVIVVAALVGYLLGTFPSADLVTRVATRGQVDIREVGTGNPGALNAMRSVGTAWGIVVMALDVAKGIVAGLIGWWIAGDDGAYAAATASIAGHIFPVWTRFRGGKGVATSAGACMAVFPLYFPLNAVVAYLTAVKSRRATIGTQVGCAIWIGAAVLWTVFDWPNLWGPPTGPGLIAFSVVGSAMILWAFWHGNRELARRAVDPGTEAPAA